LPLFSSAASASTRPHCAVPAAAKPPVPAANPEAAVYWNVVPDGIAVTAKMPLYPVTDTPVTVTLLPTSTPVGFAVLVIVTVVPLSEADVIALSGPLQVEGSPVVQLGGVVPAVHPGMDPVAVKVSATGS
jgi:hypothetical protein